MSCELQCEESGGKITTRMNRGRHSDLSEPACKPCRNHFLLWNRHRHNLSWPFYTISSLESPLLYDSSSTSQMYRLNSEVGVMIISSNGFEDNLTSLCNHRFLSRGKGILLDQ